MGPGSWELSLLTVNDDGFVWTRTLNLKVRTDRYGRMGFVRVLREEVACSVF